MPGGAWYEPKWNGFRGAMVIGSGGPRLWSRQGKDMTDRFPDIGPAAGRALTPPLPPRAASERHGTSSMNASS